MNEKPDTKITNRIDLTKDADAVRASDFQSGNVQIEYNDDGESVINFVETSVISSTKLVADSSEETKSDVQTPKYTCEICSIELNSTQNFEEHFSKHIADEASSIEVQNKLTTCISSDAGNKEFQCRFCRKRCRNEDSLIAHTRQHKGEKPFLCTVCNKDFTQLAHLTVHRRIHTGEKPFGCQICGKRFIQKINLTNHLHVHTRKRPFPCKICKISFAWEADLRVHLITSTTHNSIACTPFSCNQCEKQFKQKEYLKQHMRIHTGEKPFSCKICQKKFRTGSGVYNHEKTHKKSTESECIVTCCDENTSDLLMSK